MSYLLNPQQVGQLASLVGQKVSTSGTCSAEDETGVASVVSMASADGILKEVKVDPETGRPAILVIDDPRYTTGPIEIPIMYEDGPKSWSFHRTIKSADQGDIAFSPDN